MRDEVVFVCCGCLGDCWVGCIIWFGESWSWGLCYGSGDGLFDGWYSSGGVCDGVGGSCCCGVDGGDGVDDSNIDGGSWRSGKGECWCCCCCCGFDIGFGFGDSSCYSLCFCWKIRLISFDGGWC